MSDQQVTPSAVEELLQDHLGAKLMEDEHNVLMEGPGPVRLSEAFSELEVMNAHFASSRPGQLTTDGARGVSEGSARVLRYWRPWISAWYWNSPVAILECESCGEPKFVGSRKKARCKRKLKVEDLTVQCPGTLVPIEPPFAGRRPRPKKVKPPIPIVVEEILDEMYGVTP